MDIKSFNFEILLEIDPIMESVPPHCIVKLDDCTIADLFLKKSIFIKHETLLGSGPHCISVQLVDKSDLDTIQALKIKNIKINGISDPKFVWQGIYRPDYPEPWATQQRNQGIELSSEITNGDYLGWNGTWTLEFLSPVFTWIHQIKDLGWIYD